MATFNLTSPSTRGRTRKCAGDEAEKLVELHWLALYRRKIAWLYKLPTPHRVLKADSHTFTAVWAHSSPFDYCGYTNGGRFIAVEVKRLQCHQLQSGEWSAIRFDINALAEHQQKELFKAHQAGCLVYVVLVVSCGRSNRLFAVPFDAIFAAMAANIKSLKQSLLEQFETKSNQYLLENELRGK